MNINIIVLCTSLLIFVNSISVFGQNPPNIYVFKKGDTLYKIAKKFNVTTEYLIHLNDANNVISNPERHKYIPEGELIIVPEPGIYIVEDGDSIEKVLKIYNITIEQLKSWNPDYDPLIKDDRINPRAVLKTSGPSHEKQTNPVVPDKENNNDNFGNSYTLPKQISGNPFFSNYDVSRHDARGNEFLVYIIDLEEFKIDIHSQNEDGNFYDILSLIKEFEFTDPILLGMNAGMFEPSRLPVGLLIEKGVVKKPLNIKNTGLGNFYSLPPNGVFLVDANNSPRVLTSDDYRIQYPNKNPIPKIATQSGPMMVINGNFNPAFNEGSPNKQIRNCVGINQKGEVVLAISLNEVNFYDFSLFMKSNLGCNNVLYLDGVISNSFITAKKAFYPSNITNSPLGPILCVRKR